MRALAALLCLSWCLNAGAAGVDVCFNYGCASRMAITFKASQLARVHDLLAEVSDAEAERGALARAVGLMLAYAGEQAPIGADRAGNLADEEVDGRMDCIDHSTTTTALLHLVDEQGWLRFHRVSSPERRSFAIFQHFSAVIEETAPRFDLPPVFVVEVAAPAEPAVPDYVAPMLALCDCLEVLADIVVPSAPVVAAPGPEPSIAPEAHPGARFVVDSWFVEHGEAAIVLPLEEWLKGGGPNVQ